MDPASVNRVEAFFRHKMTDKEISQFRKDLSEDDELMQLYQDYYLAMETIDARIEDELQLQFKEWDGEAKKSKAIEKSISPLVWKIAASIILIATVGYFIFNSQKQTLDRYTLVKNSYILPESPGGKMGKGEELWAAGLNEYRNNNFERAVSNWTKIQDLTPEQEYFLAHAYFNISQFSEATSIFKMLSEGNSTYNFMADWFLALAYLADSQNEAFVKQIDKITETPNHPYAKDARQLLKKARKVFPEDDN